MHPAALVVVVEMSVAHTQLLSTRVSMYSSSSSGHSPLPRAAPNPALPALLSLDYFMRFLRVFMRILCLYFWRKVFVKKKTIKTVRGGGGWREEDENIFKYLLCPGIFDSILYPLQDMIGKLFNCILICCEWEK